MNIGKIKQLTENGFREDKKKLFSFDPDKRIEPVKTVAQRDVEWLAAVDEIIERYTEEASDNGPYSMNWEAGIDALNELKTRMEAKG